MLLGLLSVAYAFWLFGQTPTDLAQFTLIVPPAMGLLLLWARPPLARSLGVGLLAVQAIYFGLVLCVALFSAFIYFS